MPQQISKKIFVLVSMLYNDCVVGWSGCWSGKSSQYAPFLL